MKDERTTYIFRRDDKAGGGKIRGQLGTVGDGYQEWEVDPRFDLRNHSPDGFQWGYSGSGPAQAALAVLADFAGEKIATEYYQDFKREFIARHDEDQWALSGSCIRRWIFEDLGLDPFKYLKCPNPDCDDPECESGTLIGQSMEIHEANIRATAVVGAIGKHHQAAYVLGGIFTALSLCAGSREFDELNWSALLSRLPDWLSADDMNRLADLGDVFRDREIKPRQAKEAQAKAEAAGAVAN